MIDRKSNKFLVLMFALAMGGMACMCGGDEEKTESRWEKSEGSGSGESAKPTKEKKVEAEPEAGADEPAAKEEPAAPEPPAVEGGALNKSFPDDGADGYSRTFTQEKEGFAEAKFSKDGAELVMTISDTANNPSARGKFGKASDKIQGHPAMQQGKNGTVMLVNDRFQVKVTSKTVDESGRKALLEQAKLGELPN
jgi:hypothetical protein